MQPDHIIISPGPGNPKQAGICLEVIRQLAGEFPILGVCLGHQAIGEAFGGNVVHAPEIVHGKADKVYLEAASSIFKDMPDGFEAARYHSLIVEPESLPECLEVTAKTAKDEIMALQQELLADAKEIAEHNMLVDLGRNDVGRVCDFGSVKVSDYKAIKRFSHVMHITSKVTGQLSADKDALDALRAVFPAGTLSGAPKIRACEIIDELEPERRGIYGGGMGYLDFGGNMDICITIRTMVKKNDRVYIQVGGGIVADSVLDNEFQETVNKAGACMTALRMTAEEE